MATLRKRNLIQLNLDKAAAHSPYGRLFVDRYTKLEGLAERQALMFNAIASGYMLEESGLSSIFRAMDSTEFSRNGREDRMNMLQKAISLFSSMLPAPAPAQEKHPVQAASRVMTLADLEDALLNDAGVFAAASESQRAELVTKLLAKYGIPESKKTPSEERSPPVNDNHHQTVIDEDGSQQSTMAMPSSRSRVVKFNK